MIRILVLAALGMLTPATASASIERELNFRVLLEGEEIGQHRYRLEHDGAERRVESDARFTVKVLFIDAYRYVHSASERWRGDCLEALDARTDDNGERVAVRGTRAESGFVVLRAGDRSELPACVMSFAYWNKAILEQRRLLNAQTGELVDVKVQPLGAETVNVRGTPTEARRYALQAPKFRIDVWYAADGRWVQLETRTAGGKTLRYQIQ
jgi:hypothetical protein